MTDMQRLAEEVARSITPAASITMSREIKTRETVIELRVTLRSEVTLTDQAVLLGPGPEFGIVEHVKRLAHATQEEAVRAFGLEERVGERVLTLDQLGALPLGTLLTDNDGHSYRILEWQESAEDYAARRGPTEPQMHVTYSDGSGTIRRGWGAVAGPLRVVWKPSPGIPSGYGVSPYRAVEQ